jgi:hypothetical protein
MAEVTAFAVFLRIPVVGEFDLCLLVTRRREEYEREPTPFTVMASQLDETEFVAVEVERFVDICHAHHGMEVFHRPFPVEVVH